MAEPHRKSGHFQVHVSYSSDRLLEPKLAQAYEILVPCRERLVGARVKEFEYENGGDLREGFVRATARGEHDCEPDGVADRVRQRPRSRSAQRVGLLKMKATAERRWSGQAWSVCVTSPLRDRSRLCSRIRQTD